LVNKSFILNLNFVLKEPSSFPDKNVLNICRDWPLCHLRVHCIRCFFEQYQKVTNIAPSIAGQLNACTS